MLEADFSFHMNRLISNFGKQHYSPERCQILWREVSNLQKVWFGRVIDNFIGSARYAPLIPEFREEISKQREIEHQETKRQGTQDAKDFWTGSYQAEDVQTICAQIKNRIKGLVPDNDWTNFIKFLDETSNSLRVRGGR